MDLVGLLKVVARQWRVTLPVMALVLAAAVLLQMTTPPTYRASGSLIIAEPTRDAEANPVNLESLPTIARDVRLSDAFREVAVAETTTSAFVEPVPPDTLELSITGASGDAVEQGVIELADWTATFLISEQEDAGVPEEEQIQPILERVDVVPTLAEDGETQVFTASAVLILEDPLGNVSNPFRADLSTARTLQVASMSDAGREQVAARTGGEVAYQVSQDLNDRAPILALDVYSGTVRGTVESFDEVVEVLAADLDQRQARVGVRRSERLVLEVLAAPQRATDVSPPVSRAVLTLVALGLVLALGAAILAENRRRRRSTAPGSDEPWFVSGAGTESDELWRAPARERTDGGSRLGPPSG